MVSSNASLSFAEIAAARHSPDQVQFFQLYKHKDESVALKRIREVEQLGYKALFLTVDAPVPGNRERDARASWEIEDLEAAAEASESGGKSRTEMPLTSKKIEDVEEEVDTGGTAGALLANDDIDMTWDEVRPKISKKDVTLNGDVDHPVVTQCHETAHRVEGHSVCRSTQMVL